MKFFRELIILSIFMRKNEFQILGYTVKLSKFKDLSYRNKSSFTIKPAIPKNDIILRKKIQKYLEDEGFIEKIL